MEVFGDEQQLCPCYEECQEFQKLIELKDSGLVVYCHRPRKDDIRKAEAVESAVNTSRDVFILYNKKNVKITTSELTSELEKENISCPRCRKTFEHAQQLMQEVKSIDRKMVLAICDHCRKKARGSKKPFCICDKIVKKFISVGEQKEDTIKSFKILPFHLRKDTMVNKENQNAYFDFQINRGLNSSASRHEPEVQKMFSHTHYKSGVTELNTVLETDDGDRDVIETDSKEGYVKPAVAFIQPIEPMITSSARTPHEGENINPIVPGTLLVDSVTTFVKTSVSLKELPRPLLKDRKQGEIFEDRPSMDAKEALKRRHDLRLRQMMRLEKDSGVPYSVSKRPAIYETPKIAPWTQKEPTSKYYVESENDMKTPTLRHDRGPRSPRGTRDLDYVSNRDVKFRSTRATQDSFIAPREADKYHHDKIKPGLYDSDEGPKKVKKQEDRYIVDKELQLQRSVDKISHKTKKTGQHVTKSKSGPIDSIGNVLEHQYSFNFPKVMEREDKKIKIDVSSSHLIKDIQEKFRLQAEREKIRQEEHQKKIELAEKKKLAREEKRLQAEEKKRQAIEDQKKYEEVQKILNEQKYSEKILESKPVVKENKQNKPRRDKSKEKDEEIISKSKVKGKISKEPLVAKKHVMSKTYHRDKTDGLSEKNKIDVKVKSEKTGDDVVTEKRSNLKPGTEQKEKMNEVSEKAKTDLKVNGKQVDKTKDKTKEKTETRDREEKEQEIKPEREDLDEKLQSRKTDEVNLKEQFENLRIEKKAKKAQAAKEKEEIEARSKKGKTSKKTRDASDAVNVSLSKIQKSLKKEKSGEYETLIVNQRKGKESEGKTSKTEPSGTLGEVSELQKLQAKHLKDKEEALKRKKQLENETKAKEEAKRNAQKDAIEIKSIKMQKERSDANLELVIIKQAANMSPSDIHPEILNINKCHHRHSGQNSTLCQLCANSELELDILGLENKKNLTTDKTDIIIGEKIFKNKPRLEKIQELEGVPILFQKEFCVEPEQQLKHIETIVPQETKPEQKQILLTTIGMEQGTGVIRYALSDQTFIDKGWTMLPTQKVVRKMNVYRMRPAHPEFDWFEHNKNKRLMTYDTGERLAEFDDNGRGRWYYRSGRLALDYYDAEETNVQQRFVIYSSGEPDERGRSHPITILATFDYLGNGIVFDHTGKIRLKYNQTEGVVLDRGIGPVSHWKWHSLNDPPVLQQVMIDTQMDLKDPKILKLGSAEDRKTRQDNEEMLAIEFDNFFKEKSKKLLQNFKPFQIRMKALKINEHFSLKILDQATVYLIFRDGSTNLKLNIGMILDHHEIVDTDTAEVGDVSNSLERFPARTNSLEGLQRSVAHAQRYERQHAGRERRLWRPEPCASIDQLTAAASPPMRLPLRTVPTRSSSSTGYCSRKPTNNLYYDTRLRC